ncbi:hypothetical protein [Streptomyces sp. NBC_00286]|nr:hypothetical protein [Streptomyces sp. NBC_00286]
MRVARRIATVLTASAVMVGAFATQAAAIAIEAGGAMIEVPI